jgi:hypothetical protein
MPTLSIKDVPEPVAQALRERARLNHRSLQGELLSLVTAAAAAQDPLTLTLTRSPSRPVPVASVRSPATEPGSLKPIELIAREHAARRARPVRSGPSAGQQVRADREGR